MAVLIGLLITMNRDEWFVALTFGVLIDMDHLIAAPRYVTENGWMALFRPTWDDASGLPWKSLFHYPVGAFFVAPAAIGWRYMIPLLFWGVHVGLDYLQNAVIQYSGIVESFIFAGACAGILWVGYRRWRELGADGDFMAYLRGVKSGITAYASAIRTRLGNIV